jgi:sporulation protein YlmC with PRC-barrel domain
MKENRLAGELDAVLHLMDRQVLDVEGRMVCKVDDVELIENDDGALVVSGLLAGAAALVPRFGGRLGERALERWGQLGVEQADRMLPYRIDIGDVERLGSAVELRVARQRLLTRQPLKEGGLSRRRLNELMWMRVHGDGGTELGNVIDVRLSTRGGPGAPILVTGLVVGRGRPGGYLGYDRGPDQGPWLLNRVVRWLHRHSGLVGIDNVARFDWEAETLTVAGTDLDDLTRAGSATPQEPRASRDRDTPSAR